MENFKPEKEGGVGDKIKKVAKAVGVAAAIGAAAMGGNEIRRGLIARDIPTSAEKINEKIAKKELEYQDKNEKEEIDRATEFKIAQNKSYDAYIDLYFKYLDKPEIFEKMIIHTGFFRWAIVEHRARQIAEKAGVKLSPWTKIEVGATNKDKTLIPLKIYVDGQRLQLSMSDFDILERQSIERDGLENEVFSGFK